MDRRMRKISYYSSVRWMLTSHLTWHLATDRQCVVLTRYLASARQYGICRWQTHKMAGSHAPRGWCEVKTHDNDTSGYVVAMVDGSISRQSISSISTIYLVSKHQTSQLILPQRVKSRWKTYLANYSFKLKVKDMLKNIYTQNCEDAKIAVRPLVERKHIQACR